MGLIGWMKQKLNIGGVTVQVKAPGQAPKNAGKISGTIVLTTKSPQEVESVLVKVVEEYSTGRGAEKSTEDFTLGEIEVVGAFKIAPGETKNFEFEVPFSLLKSSNDRLKEKGGVLGAVGSMGSFMNAEKSNYFVVAEADVKGAINDPSARSPIRLT